MSSEFEIFIVGFARSGTTLVQSILASHSKVFSAPETSYFMFLCQNGWGMCDPEYLLDSSEIERYARYFHETTGMHLGKKQDFPSRESARLFFQRIMDSFNHGGKPLWVEKTTAHIQYMMAIRRFYPDAKFIHVIRDPVECISSLRGLRPVTLLDSRIRMVSSYRRLAKIWNQSFELSLLYPDQHNVLHVLYEDLLRDPRQTVSAMCQFLGLDFEEHMLERFHETAGAFFSERHCPWQAENSRQGFHKEKIGRHRQALPPRQVWLVDFYTSRFSRFLGYSSAPRPGYLAIFLTLAQDLILDLLSFSRLEMLVRMLLAQSTSLARRLGGRDA